MLKQDEMQGIVKERLEEADILCRNGKLDGAVYLCGYAVEIGLKARICRTLGWTEFPDSREYQSFKTHDLDVLLHLSGVESKVKDDNRYEWSGVAFWDSNFRYKPIGSSSETVAKDMIAAARELLHALEVL